MNPDGLIEVFALCSCGVFLFEIACPFILCTGLCTKMRHGASLVTFVLRVSAWEA